MLSLLLPHTFDYLSNIDEEPKDTAKSSLEEVLQWGQFERILTSTNHYSDEEKYRDVDLTATFVGPEGQTFTVPGFWDDGSTWRIRFSPPTLGLWTYQVTSSDSQLETETNNGRFIATPPDKKTIKQNPNHRGFLRVSSNGRYLTYADDTPFFWLGGTAWRGDMLRMGFISQPDDLGPDVAEFPYYVDNRKAKGFTAVQILPGFLAEPQSQNEGGSPFDQPFNVINPDHFQWLDKRIQYISDQGLVAVIFGQWYSDLDAMSLAELEQYWTYLVARYQSYNVIWVVTGEYGFLDDLEKVRQLGEFVQELDTTNHLVSIHPTPNDPQPSYSSTDHFGDDAWVDLILHQTWDQRATRDAVVKDYNRETAVPIINAEAGYDGLWGWTRDMVRQDAWTVYLSGGAGYTYGANGIFNWNDGCCDDEKYAPPRWYDVIDLPSSTDMTHLVTFFSMINWWEFEPYDQLVNHGYATARSDEEYVVYLPASGESDGSGWSRWLPRKLIDRQSVTIDLSGREGHFEVTWFNPRTGRFTPQIMIIGGESHTLIAPFTQDAVLHLKSK